MRSFTAAASATAAMALLTVAGLAFALPPEPASAPKGAHMAAGPPPAAVRAAPTSGAVPGITPNGNSTAPYDITSEGVEVLQPQRLVIFKGNVEVTQDTARLRTPELHVFYKPKPGPRPPARWAWTPAAWTTWRRPARPTTSRRPRTPAATP
jgi:hypothetical protein